ncbi:MAG: hypothetical protein ACYDAH_11480 [Steroidobacteraceae bacterium]
MRGPLLLTLVALQSALPGKVVADAVPASVELRYPGAARGEQIDRYRGVMVADPYRWMEDVDAPATRAWVEAEAKLTSDYLAAIPGRDRIAQRLKEIWNFERWGAPEKHGAGWFFTHRTRTRRATQS